MDTSLKINNVLISESGPVVTIAEAAVEHLGSVLVAKRMVDEAKAAGADFIKFQMHLPDKEMIPNSIHFWGGSMDDVLRMYNLSVDDHRTLIDYCRDKGIQYLCTPFCADAADVLDELGVPAFKLGSGEMTNIPMLRHIARKGKPMIVSTGMCTMDEIAATVDMLKKENARFMLTNCTSIYPPPYERINLGLIPKLKERFGVLVGHSDHTPNIWTALGAVAMGAKVIEKHFTIDRRLKGPDYEVSLEPQEFSEMTDAIHKLEMALGSTKSISPEEEIVRRWAHHSVVSLRKIAAGTPLTKELLGVKRPGSGIPARHLDELMGRVAARDIPADTLLSWDDLKK